MNEEITCFNEQLNNLKLSDNLYIIKVTNKYGCEILKFGYTSNLKERILCYLAYNPFLEIVGTFYRSDAREFELWFHKSNLSTYKNEWYPINMLDFITISIHEVIDLEEKHIVGGKKECKKM